MALLVRIYVSMMHYGLKAPWRAVAIYNWPPNTGSVSTCDNCVFNKPLDWSLHCTLALLTAHPAHSTALHLLTPFTGSLTTLWEHRNSCVHAEKTFSRNNRDWCCHWIHTHLSSHQRSCMFHCSVLSYTVKPRYNVYKSSWNPPITHLRT